METSQILEKITQERALLTPDDSYGHIHFSPLELGCLQSTLITHFGNVLNISNRIKKKVGIKPICIIPRTVFEELAESMAQTGEWNEKIFEYPETWFIDLRNMSKDFQIPVSKDALEIMERQKGIVFLHNIWRSPVGYVIRNNLYAVVFGLITIAIICTLAFGAPLTFLLPIVFLVLRHYVIRGMEWNSRNFTAFSFFEASVLLFQGKPKDASYCRLRDDCSYGKRLHRDYGNPSEVKATVFFNGGMPKHFEKSLGHVFKSGLQPCVLSNYRMIDIAVTTALVAYPNAKSIVNPGNSVRRENDPLLYVIEKEGDVDYAVCLDYYGPVEERFIENAKAVYRKYFTSLHSST